MRCVCVCREGGRVMYRQTRKAGYKGRNEGKDSGLGGGGWIWKQVGGREREVKKWRSKDKRENKAKVRTRSLTP